MRKFIYGLIALALLWLISYEQILWAYDLGRRPGLWRYESIASQKHAGAIISSIGFAIAVALSVITQIFLRNVTPLRRILATFLVVQIGLSLFAFMSFKSDSDLFPYMIFHEANWLTLIFMYAPVVSIGAALFATTITQFLKKNPVTPA